MDLHEQTPFNFSSSCSNVSGGRSVDDMSTFQTKSDEMLKIFPLSKLLLN